MILRQCPIEGIWPAVARRAVVFAVTLVVATGPSNTRGQNPSATVPEPLSPDGKWEFKCSDRFWSSIVKTGSGEIVVNLNDLDVPYCDSATVVWAPDSKRFAFNYSPAHRPHTSYETVAVFELRAGKWIAFPQIVEEKGSGAQLLKLAKPELPKDLQRLRDQPLRDILKVRNWIDANTVILYASAVWTGKRDAKAAFLLTVKFDADGKSKIVRTERLPDKDIED